MKFRTLLTLIVAVALLACTGCISTYRAQLQDRVPKVDADLIRITGHTIYGVSGELTETGVKWVNGVKTIATSHSRVDSPIGSFTVDIEKGKIRP